MYIITSFIFWLIASPLAIVAYQDVSTDQKYLSIGLAVLSIIFALISASKKKTAVASVILILLDILIVLFVVATLIRPYQEAFF